MKVKHYETNGCIAEYQDFIAITKDDVSKVETDIFLYGLDKQKRSIVKLLIYGYTIIEISEKLHISIQEIENIRNLIRSELE